MKLIIDIDEKVYKEYMNLATGRIPTYKACDIAYILKNGIPLPQRRKTGGSQSWAKEYYANGWNDCLEMIGSESK